MHEMLIAEHGGPSGLVSESALESSLASPQNLVSYGSPDLQVLAARYAASLTRNHPFRDGNRRLALTVAAVFLELNGFRLEAAETDAVTAILALSTKQLDEAAFAEWLRLNSRAIPAAATTAKGRSKRPVRKRRTKGRRGSGRG
jgi:death-on-curing protein